MNNFMIRISLIIISGVLTFSQSVFAQTGTSAQSSPSGQSVQVQKNPSGQNKPIPAPAHSTSTQTTTSPQGVRSVPGKNNPQITDSITQSQISDSVTQSPKK
jgi:hypothetical protein